MTVEERTAEEKTAAAETENQATEEESAAAETENPAAQPVIAPT